MSLKHNYDGLRGRTPPMNGWWITKEEAVEKAGEPWWKLPLCQKVQCVQHDPTGPKDKPIWMYANGDMYLGPWKKGPLQTEVLMEHGFGAVYYHAPAMRRGNVYVGTRRYSQLQGKGESCWLESCEAWDKNHSPRSMISGSPTSRKGVPFCYKGYFLNGGHNDVRAVVTLKDGTRRMGPWRDGSPLGEWHDHPRTTAACSWTAEEWEEEDQVVDEVNDSENTGQNGGKSAAAQSTTECSYIRGQDDRYSRKPAPKQRVWDRPRRTVVYHNKQKRNEDERMDSSLPSPAKCHSTSRQQHKRVTTNTPTSGEFQGSPPTKKSRGEGCNLNAVSPDVARSMPAGSAQKASAAQNRTKSFSSRVGKPPSVICVTNSASSSIGESQSLLLAGVDTAVEDLKRQTQICDYLSKDLIGCNPSPITMKRYAHRLYKMGFESVEMIQKYLKPEHVRSAEWMASLHKDIILQKLPLRGQN